jgi:flagellar motor component MotA
MKFRWIFLLAANFANSLFMAFILLSMYTRNSHALTLVEPNELIITIEAIFSTFIVISSVTVACWNFVKKPKDNV